METDKPINPDEVIAFGAAVQSAVLTGEGFSQLQDLPVLATILREGGLGILRSTFGLLYRAGISIHADQLTWTQLWRGTHGWTILRGHPLESEVCESNVRSGFRVHSKFAIQELAALSKASWILTTCGLRSGKSSPRPKRALSMAFTSGNRQVISNKAFSQ